MSQIRYLAYRFLILELDELLQLGQSHNLTKLHAEFVPSDLIRVQLPYELSCESEARVDKSIGLFNEGGVEQVVFSVGVSWQMASEEVDKAVLMRDLAI